MKIIKYIAIAVIFLIILFSCTGVHKGSRADNLDPAISDAPDCLEDEISDQNDEEIDFSGEGVFFKPDPSMWPKN